MYGTITIDRRRVRPGMAVKHNGILYRASASTEKGLYIHRLHETRRITDDQTEICINHQGQPLNTDGLPFITDHSN